MWNQIQQFLEGLPPVAWNLLLAGIAVLAGLLITWIISYFVKQACSKTSGFSLLRSVLQKLARPVNFFLPLLILDQILPFMKLDPAVYNFLNKGTDVLLIVAFAAVFMGIIKVLEDYAYHHYKLDDDIHDLKERKIRTQLVFIRKVINVLIIILTICAILLSFESLRKIGAGLLTGVGIGGIIIGFAAQRSLGNLFAGLQIAFTQPIRIDDFIVVEGESGLVEEITLTYVVLNIWDQRRLILPINYFIERPFQNHTRKSSELLGTVHLYLDYTAPVDEIRKEFTRLIESSPLWDKRAAAIHVTNNTENTMEIRALVSAQDGGKAFELRCFIREHLLKFINENYPDCLPKTRATVEGELQLPPPARHIAEANLSTPAPSR
jgi:small-conductance mechanosensitive channel